MAGAKKEAVPLVAAEEPEIRATPRRVLAAALVTPPSTGRDVPMVDAYGTQYMVPAANAQEALASGFRPSTRQAFAAAEREAKYGSTGQRALTAAEGAGAGLTFGLSDLALTGALGEEYRREAQARAEVNPWTRTGGEVVGAVVPLLLSGGTSGAATAGKLGMTAEALATGARTAEAVSGGSRALALARGVGAMPRGVAALGRGVERGVAGALGEGRFARVISKAAGAGVEGAAYGAGGEISRASLDDTPLTGERIVAGMGRGALLGVALGGGLGALGEGKTAFLRMMRSAEGAEGGVASKAEAVTGPRAAATGLPNVAESPVVAKLAKATGADAEILEIMRTSQGRKYALEDLAAASERRARVIRSDLDTVARADVDVGTEFIQNKPATARRLVDNGVASTEGLAASRDVVERVRGLRQQMAADPMRFRKVGKQGAKLEELANTYEKQIERIVAEGGDDMGSKLFMQADYFKSAFGTIAAASKKGGRAGAKSPLQVFYDANLKPMLEDARKWGAMAEVQRTVNPEITKGISLQEAMAGLKKGTGGRAEYNAWEKEFTHDPGKIKALIERSGSVESEVEIKIMRDYLANNVKKFDIALKHYTPGGAAKEKIAAGYEAAKRAQSEFDAALEHARVIQKRSSEEARGPGALAKVIGSLPGGERISGLLSTNPISLARKVETIAQAAATGDALFGTRLEGFVRRMTSAKGSAEAAARGSRVMPAASQPKRLTIPVVLTGKRAVDAIETRRRELQRLSDPAVAAETYSKAVAPMVDVAPRAAAETMATLDRGTQFLLAKMPPAPAPGNAFTPQFDAPRMPTVVAEKFARYDRAVEHPASVMHDLEHGTLTAEAVEALRAVQPGVYQDLQERALIACASAAKALPYSARVRLSVLLDVQGDPTQARPFVQAMQASYSGGKGMAPGAMKPPSAAVLSAMKPGELGQSIQTRTTSLEQGLGS